MYFQIHDLELKPLISNHTARNISFSAIGAVRVSSNVELISNSLRVVGIISIIAAITPQIEMKFGTSWVLNKRI